jgi:hypothetical protein
MQFSVTERFREESVGSRSGGLIPVEPEHGRGRDDR